MPDRGREMMMTMIWNTFRPQERAVMGGEEFSRIFGSLLASLRSQKLRDEKVTKIDENILLGQFVSWS